MLENGQSANSVLPIRQVTPESHLLAPVHVWRQANSVELPRRRAAKRQSRRERSLSRSAVARRPHPLYMYAKRALDIAVTSLAILLLSPLLLLITVAIRLTSKGPAIYKHTRVGLRGREFTCYKFRSMVVNADQLKEKLREQNQHEDSRTFKMARDPRITTVGRILRKSSLDELPQLFNVLFGDMSLVGPRPPVPCEVEQYSWDDLRRLEVKPGITCIWQVSGRSNIPFPQQLQMDIDYIEQQSMLLDLKLLVQTVPAVLTANGAC